MTADHGHHRGNVISLADWRAAGGGKKEAPDDALRDFGAATVALVDAMMDMCTACRAAGMEDAFPRLVVDFMQIATKAADEAEDQDPGAPGAA